MSHFYFENNYYAVQLRSGALVPFKVSEVRDWCWIGTTAGVKRIIPIHAIEWADIMRPDEYAALEEDYSNGKTWGSVATIPTSPIKRNLAGVDEHISKKGPGRPRKEEVEV